MSNNFKDDEQVVVAEFVATFERLMETLGSATEVRYEAPPRSAAAKGVGKDPTGDTVIDDQREALESTIRTTAQTLRVADLHMRNAISALNATLAPYCE